MTLDEFRRHPAYDYYIRTLVSNCLVCDLETKFDNQYTIIYMKRPNFENKRKDYIISVPCDIADESEEFLYSTIKIQDDSKVTFLCKYESNKHIQSCNYCPLVKYLCLGIDCHTVILKQIKYEKK